MPDLARIDAAPNMRLTGAYIEYHRGTSYASRYDLKRWYDDGYGPLWIYRDAGGLIGLVRARTWSDAFEICQDVIFDDADPADLPTDPEADLPEGIGYRNNGPDPSRPWCQTGFYQEDLNGSRLDVADAYLLEELRITVCWANDSETE